MFLVTALCNSWKKVNSWTKGRSRVLNFWWHFSFTCFFDFRVFFLKHLKKREKMGLSPKSVRGWGKVLKIISFGPLSREILICFGPISRDIWIYFGPLPRDIWIYFGPLPRDIWWRWFRHNWRRMLKRREPKHRVTFSMDPDSISKQNKLNFDLFHLINFISIFFSSPDCIQYYYYEDVTQLIYSSYNITHKKNVPSWLKKREK